jgi:hypothetical protein
MNIAMEQTEEYVDGQLKSKYGDCFIRGNNGAFNKNNCFKICNRVLLTFTLCRYVVLYISSQKR